MSTKAVTSEKERTGSINAEGAGHHYLYLHRLLLGGEAREESVKS